MKTLIARVFDTFHTVNRRPAKPVRFRPALCALEAREVPAVLTTFSPAGVLSIRIDNNSQTGQSIVVYTIGGSLVVNNAIVKLAGRPVATSAVRSIDVIGSDLGNRIDLGQVDRVSFSHLDGRVRVDARGGDDYVIGTPYADVLIGGDGNDQLHGRDGANTIDGGAGNDYLTGGEGWDVITGGAGNDYVHAGAGNDSINGGDGDDRLIGSDGNDSINGGNGNDALFGEAGNDTLVGGAGDDYFGGGPGVDRFDGGLGYDTVADGVLGEFYVSVERGKR